MEQKVSDGPEFLLMHQPRSGQNTFWGALIGGIFFSGFGYAVQTWGYKLMVDNKIFPAGADSAKVVQICSICLFILAGGMFSNCLKIFADKLWLSFTRSAHEKHPWLYDYRWDSRKSKGESGNNIINNILGLSFFVGLATVCYWLGLHAREGRLIAFAIAGIAVLVIVATIGYIFYVLIRRLKYGSSYLKLETFPFFLGETFEAQIMCPAGIGQIDKITMTLRCIEEARATSMHRKESGAVSSNSQLICEQLYSIEQTIEANLTHSGRGIPIQFPLPENEDYESALSQKPMRYWQLEVKADTPGIDFKAKYLVPVYKKV